MGSRNVVLGRQVGQRTPQCTSHFSAPSFTTLAKLNQLNLIEPVRDCLLNMGAPSRVIVRLLRFQVVIKVSHPCSTRHTGVHS
jgi:hypothetical protein